MDCSLSNHSKLPFIPPAGKPKSPDFLPALGFSSGRASGSCGGGLRVRRAGNVVAAAGVSRWETGSSLNTPIEPRSESGKFLSSVLLNQRQLFHFAAADELKQLADQREEAVNRMFLSSESDEACLHRRIAQLKENDNQTAIQDIMYILVVYHFSEIRVPLVPELSRCAYNGRLEILPTKDWDLESIYSLEVLELVKEYVSAVVGLRVNSSVNDNWTTTQIKKLRLSKVYAASILFGYFLKSASLRHNLECSLALGDQNLCLNTKTIQIPKDLVFRRSVSKGQQRLEWKKVKGERLRCFVSEFDPDAYQRCAKPKSKEATNLIEKQRRALFGDNECDEVIRTSFSSVKRLVLEAVAFGWFLWDTEEFVDKVYKLKENAEEGSAGR